MALVSDLIVKLTLDNKAFNSTMSSTHSELAKLKDSFKEKLVEVASIATIAAGFHKLADVIHETTEEVSKLVDTATGLDITTEALEKLQWAGSQNSLSNDDMASSLAKLQKNLVEATADADKSQQTIAGLSLTYSQLANIPLDQQFLRIAEAIKNTTNPADQARAAYELFGKSGTKMLTLMRDDVKGLTEEFESLGAGISGKQAAAIEKYGDSVAKMQKTFSAFGNQLTASLAPALTVTNELFTILITSWGGLGEIGKSVGSILIANMLFVTDTIIATTKALQALEIGFLKFERGVTKYGTLGISTFFEGDKEMLAKIEEAQARFDNPKMQQFRDQLYQQGVELNMTTPAVNKLEAPRQENKTSQVDVNVKVGLSKDLIGKVVNSRENKTAIKNMMLEELDAADAAFAEE